jgi:hypothetical protein
MMLFAEVPINVADQFWIAFFASIPATIAAIAAAIVSVLNARKANQLEGKLHENTELTRNSVDVTEKKVDSALAGAKQKVEESVAESQKRVEETAQKAVVFATAAARKTVDETKEQFAELKAAVNGQTRQLLEETKRAAYQEGFNAGLQSKG